MFLVQFFISNKGSAVLSVEPLPFTHHNNVVNKVLAIWNDFANINNRNSVSFPEPHDRLMF